MALYAVEMAILLSFINRLLRVFVVMQKQGWCHIINKSDLRLE